MPASNDCKYYTFEYQLLVSSAKGCGLAVHLALNWPGMLYDEQPLAAALLAGHAFWWRSPRADGAITPVRA